jgi:hypothetical protein
VVGATTTQLLSTGNSSLDEAEAEAKLATCNLQLSSASELSAGEEVMRTSILHVSSSLAKWGPFLFQD